MISTRPMRYQFEFCHPNEYSTFVRAIKGKTSVYRIGFVGIENLRLFVNVQRGRFYPEVYQKQGNSWVAYTKPVKLIEPDVGRMCHSAQEFEEALVEVFFKAFPRAEEAFYENMPTHQEILAKLSGNPTLSEMDHLRLLYVYDDDAGIEDADGYVTITCDDGTVCIPFDKCKGDSVLQMYRAKFHPEAPVSNAFNSCFDWLEDLWSRITSITLTGVLRKIDNLVK